MSHSHDKYTNVLIVEQPFDADGNETPFGPRWGGERFTLTEKLGEQMAKGAELDAQKLGGLGYEF